MTERDRFWLRHLERQAAGAETSKAYAAREKLSRRAAASKGRRAERGGRRWAMCEPNSQGWRKDIV